MKPKIKSVYYATSFDLDELEIEVNQKIKEGYQPVGNLFGDSENYFVQPMVKLEEVAE